MSQTTFDAPMALYPGQLEDDLRASSVGGQGLSCYGKNGGTMVIYARELSAAEVTTVEAVIAAHVPDHRERDRLIRLRQLAKTIKEAEEQWGSLTNAQKDASMRRLHEFTWKAFRELVE